VGELATVSPRSKSRAIRSTSLQPSRTILRGRLESPAVISNRESVDAALPRGLTAFSPAGDEVSSGQSVLTVGAFPPEKHIMCSTQLVLYRSSK
jgi:hypothetical protein